MVLCLDTAPGVGYARSMMDIRFDGLERFQRQLDEAVRAVQNLEGELRIGPLKSGDSADTQRLIHEMEAVVDSRLDRYRGNPLVRELSEKVKGHLREMILDKASRHRHLNSAVMNNQGKDEDLALNPAVELKKKQRFEYMRLLYDKTGGNEHAHVSMWELGTELGLERGDTDMTVQYLDGEGLLKYVAIGGSIAITHRGIVEVEAAIQDPGRPTQHFPAVQNIIHVQSMTHSVIQQGTTNSSQSVSFSANDLAAVKAFIAEFNKVLPELSLEPDLRDEARAELGTVSAQMESPKPKLPVIAASLRVLGSITERAAGAVVAHGLIQLWPAVAEILHRLNL